MEEYKSGESNLDFVDSIQQTEDSEKDFHWVVIMNGPPNTPYEGGKFEIDLHYTHLYPGEPPLKTLMKTKIYHFNFANIDDEEPGIHIIDKMWNWKREYVTKHILTAIYKLLQEPDNRYVKSPDAYNLYEKNSKEYESKAKEWTLKYAKIDKKSSAAKPAIYNDNGDNDDIKDDSKVDDKQDKQVKNEDGNNEKEGNSDNKNSKQSQDKSNNGTMNSASNGN